MQPQHFQLAELYEQFRYKTLIETGIPHFWGVGALDIPDEAVLNRVVEIRAARLLFPDRTYVEYPGNAVLAPRRFDESAVEEGRPMTVYVGLRRLALEGNNVTLCRTLDEASAAGTRYASLADSVEVPDVHSDGPAAPVHTLLHVIKVLFEGEIEDLGQYDVIPIGQLVRHGDSVTMSEQFVAPTYAISGSDILLKKVREICDELAARARQLQELKSPFELQGAMPDSQGMMLLLALRTLSRACPSLFHLVQTPTVHPWHVYGALRQLVGELSTFSQRFGMQGETDDGRPGLPLYDHRALYICFSRAQAVIRDLLADISISPEYLVVLEYQDGAYSGEIPRSVFDRYNRFYLILRSEKSDARLIEDVLRDARLADTLDMANLLSHALPGLELIALPTAPHGLPRRAASCYFRIEQASQLWDRVESGGNIALHWPEAPQDLRAEVVVLRS